MSKFTQGSSKRLSKIETAKTQVDKLEEQIKQLAEQKKLAQANYEQEIQKFFEPFNKWLNQELLKHNALNTYSLNELQEVIKEHYLSKLSVEEQELTEE